VNRFENDGSWWSRLTTAAFSIFVVEHSDSATALAISNRCPAKRPSPKKSASVDLAEIHRRRDANTASEMRSLPTRTDAGRNPEDDVACGQPEVGGCLALPFATLSRQDGKSHGNNQLQVKTHRLPRSPRTPATHC